MKEGQSYLKDSRQLINELKNVEVEENYILVTIDVNSLYTNIVQEDGIQSVEWAFYNQTNMKEEQIRYIIEGLRLAMSHNYVWYKGEYFT